MNIQKRFPCVADMRLEAEKRIPKFAWDYMSGGMGLGRSLEHNYRALSKVKLDHTFVRDAMETDQGRKLLAAIIGLLRQMKLNCCVEGVETPEIETFVAANGCKEVQGYLIGRPQLVDAADLDTRDRSTVPVKA